MADNHPQGRDPAALRNTLDVQINPATEDTLLSLVTQGISFAGLVIPKSDAVYATYPTPETEVYTFKLSGVTVGTVTVSFTDSTKNVLVSAIVT